MTTRRTFLITGAASIALIGSGIGHLILSKPINAARKPWLAAADGFGDPCLDSLAYAILAPSPHNRQPWIVRLDGADSLTLFCDLDRTLPETDPPNRQITISLGAFLELLRQAAAERGFFANIEYFPDGEPYPVLDHRPIAQVSLIKSSQVRRDPLFGFVLNRRTVRSNFSEKPISKQVLEELNHLAYAEMPKTLSGFTSTIDSEQVSRLKEICHKGWEIEATTPRTLNESVRLTRIGADEVINKPDGISLYGAKMEALKLLGLMSRNDMSMIGSGGHKATLSFYNELISSTSAFGWISTPSNTRMDQLRAGSIWVRLGLAAAKMGIAMHPLSQVLQEFEEMKKLYADFHREIGMDGESRVQGLFRFGYANYPEASPRWPLESRLIRS